MAIAIYRFARFEPDFPSPAADPEGLAPAFVIVGRPAPDGVNRPELNSRIALQQLQPADTFQALSIRHDEVGHYDAYEEQEGDGPLPEEVVRHYFVYPKDYRAYELINTPGEVFIQAPLEATKELFRRYRSTMNPPNAIYRRRQVNLRALEVTLRHHQHIEPGAYTLANIPSDTPILRMQVSAQQIIDNDEVQDLKDRAESIGILEFGYPYGDELLRISIDALGAVKFHQTPGDAPALEVLSHLEPYIRQHSELVAFTVGQGGGG